MAHHGVLRWEDDLLYALEHLDERERLRDDGLVHMSARHI